jgi:hypothetical protein
MSTPILSVTENRVTVTANDTEANIRAAAGFPAAPEPDEDAPTADTEPATDKPKAADAERNTDGTFKAKAADPSKPAETPKKADGDPRTSHQAKINAAIAKQRDAERRAEEAERRANEREAELQALRQPKPSQTPAPTPQVERKPTHLELVQRYQSHPDAPKAEDFINAGVEDPYAAHQAAMALFIADQRLAEREASVERARVARERETTARTALEIGEQRYPGFQQRFQAQSVPMSTTALSLLADETARDPESSADLLQHLMTHPDEAAALGAMTNPIAAAREIGRLIARLASASSGPDPDAMTHTNAKPLIKPVGASVMAPESSPPEELPFGPKYIAAMNERDRKARESRRA